MIGNQLETSAPDIDGAEQETAAAPQSVALAQVAKALLNNALMQAKFNQSIKASIQDLADGIHQTREILQRLSQSLNQQVERLSANSQAGGRIAALVGDDLVLTKVLNTFLMYVEATDMSVAPHLIADGYWEKTITQAFGVRLRPGMTVIDVGANYGYYSLIAACRLGDTGRVYSFEPNPRTFEILKKNIEVNWLGHIIRPHQLAALDSPRQVELHALRRFQGGSSLFAPLIVPEKDPPPEQRPIVSAMPVDEIVQEKVDVIKIDAEGSEPLVLEGMRGILNRSPDLTIFMEVNVPMIRQTMDPSSFLQKVRELGGTIHYFTPWNTLELFEEEKALRFNLFNLLIERK